MTYPNTTQGKKLDARIVKTLASIENAFLSLIAKKDYDDITVGDILAAANINRTTFYKYYNNKNELTRSIVDSLKDNVLEPLVDKRFSLSWEEFSKEIPNLFDVHRQKIELLWKIRTPKINLKNDFYELVKEKYITASQNCKDYKPSDNLDFQGHVFASFCISMLEYGFNHESIEPNELQHNLNNVLKRIAY